MAVGRCEVYNTLLFTVQICIMCVRVSMDDESYPISRTKEALAADRCLFFFSAAFASLAHLSPASRSPIVHASVYVSARALVLCWVKTSRLLVIAKAEAAIAAQRRINGDLIVQAADSFIISGFCAFRRQVALAIGTDACWPQMPTELFRAWRRNGRRSSRLFLKSWWPGCGGGHPSAITVVPHALRGRPGRLD